MGIMSIQPVGRYAIRYLSSFMIHDGEIVTLPGLVCDKEGGWCFDLKTYSMHSSGRELSAMLVQ